jgi:putative transposase
MKHNPAVHHRRSIRLQGYDYSRAGAYFVTICTWNREYRFGEIVDGAMQLNDAGRVVKQCWEDIPVHFPHVALDESVIMPNHVHGIVFINHIDRDHDMGAKNLSPLQSRPQAHPTGTSKTIGSVVRGFKIGVTKWVRQHTSILDVWQRNYWEHVIRNDSELTEIRQYISNNPMQWDLDSLNHLCRGEKSFAPTVRGEPEIEFKRIKS